jgi:hypothetical protein
MASLRAGTRRDGKTYVQVLYRLDGKQSSTSFEDPASAKKFQKALAHPTSVSQTRQSADKFPSTVHSHVFSGRRSWLTPISLLAFGIHRACRKGLRAGRVLCGGWWRMWGVDEIVSSCSSAWAGLSTTAVLVVLNYRHSCPARYPAL